MCGIFGVTDNKSASRLAYIGLFTLQHRGQESAESTFDLILANIQADVLCDLAPAMAAKLAPEGRVILSGILCDQSDDVLAAYARAGFGLDTQKEEGEWTGLLLRKATSTGSSQG